MERRARQSFLGQLRRQFRRKDADSKQVAVGAAATAQAAADSIERIQSAPPCHRRYAVVAALPPAKTGIAYATAETYRGRGDEVDLFTRFETASAYEQLASEASSAVGCDVFDVSALAPAAERRGYRAIILAIGNSSHNLFVVDELARLAHGAPAPVYLHAHDPCLIELWGIIAALNGWSRLSELRSVYGLGSARLRFNRKAALAAGCIGLSAVIGNAPLAGIIVNSEAARALAKRDLALAKRPIPVLAGFHPVFPPRVPPIAARAANGPLKIGTFGFPGAPKRTEFVFKAVRLLDRSGVSVQLLLAGYGVSAYLAEHRGLRNALVTGVDTPSDVELETLMNEVDVAVQLREEALGESSGIVTQLLALGRPVVVTGHGSFLEYGNAVATVAPNATARALADAIVSAHRAHHALRRAAEDYCATRSPAAFMAWLNAAIGSN